jgi:hypothetical protein
MTAAARPSVEELVLGAIPWIPRVRLHNPLLSYENGDEFVQIVRKAAEGKLKPFVLVVEDSMDRIAARSHFQSVRPGMRMMELSSKTAQGMDGWMGLLASHVNGDTS